MATRKVLAYNSMPARMPVEKTIIAFLLLDRFKAPMWLWIMMIVMFACLWTFCIAASISQKQISFNRK